MKIYLKSTFLVTVNYLQFIYSNTMQGKNHIIFQAFVLKFDDL